MNKFTCNTCNKNFEPTLIGDEYYAVNGMHFGTFENAEDVCSSCGTGIMPDLTIKLCINCIHGRLEANEYNRA